MIALPVGVVMTLTYVVRRSVGLDRLGHNNEVAGFKYAVLGVIYAVLLGFAVIVVWENFRDGQSSVMAEASAISTIYRLAEGVDPAASTAVRSAAMRYGETVVSQEAPAMAMGQASPAATIALSRLYEALLAAKPATLEQSDAFQNLLVSLQTLSDARRDRLELAGSTVPQVIWLVLFGGGLLNVAFLLFFGTRHVWVQMVMSGMLTAVIFMALFSIVMIDHPFAGSVRVSMEPIAYVLEHVAQQD
jgi:hypothetical protein